MKKALLAIGAALLLCSLPASAQTGTWTAVASSGVMDESASTLYAFTGPNLTYRTTTSSLAPIVARYNVTNTWGGGMSDVMPWTTLELGYFTMTIGAANAQARLIRVDPCTGVELEICKVSGVASGVDDCETCRFPAGTVDFSRYLYYVEVTLTRLTTTIAPPIARTLRIY